MALNNKKFFIGLKEYAIITVGILCYTGGWNIFLIPNNLVGGGVTGISSILQYATHGVVPMGISYLVINAILLLASFFILGIGMGAKTIYAIVLASASLDYMGHFIPADFIQAIAIDNGKLMSTIMGGMMAGLGIGISMSQGGSTGGTDIIALIANKYRGISPGRMILWMDVGIIVSSLIFPSFKPDGTLVPLVDKILAVVYGLILVTVNGTVIDLYLAGSKQSVQLFILSSKYAEIADMITHDLHRGVTVLDGKGWYTQQNTEVLMVITRKTDLNLLLRTIKTIDANAFLSVSTVTGVYGKGFDSIKGKQQEGKTEGKTQGKTAEKS